MKEYIKIIIYLLVFILLIIISVKSYNYLTQEYSIQEEQNFETEALENIIENATLEKAKDFTVIDSNENKISLSDYIGKPVVVNFWATWCGPCKVELPAFESLSKQYADKVEFMMVNLTDGYQETVEEVKKFIKENKYEFPVFFDTEQSVSNSYNLNYIPQTIFIDKNGNLVNSHIGAMSESTLKNYIEDLIKD